MSSALFNGTRREIENTFNTWLREHPQAEVTAVTQRRMLSDSSKFIVIIWYKKISMLNLPWHGVKLIEGTKSFCEETLKNWSEAIKKEIGIENIALNQEKPFDNEDFWMLAVLYREKS